MYVWQVRHAQQQQQQQEGSTSAASSGISVVRHALQGHSPSTQVKACCLSADGCWAATGGSDGKVLLWDLSALADPAAAAAITAPASSSPAASTGAAPRSHTCCVPSPPGLAKMASEWQLGQLGREHTTCLALSADGSVLAVGTRSGKVHVALSACSSDSWQLLQLPARHTDGYKVRCVALSPDASKLLSSADDARMVLWDVGTRSCMLSLHEHTKPIRGCCWSPNGKHICSVGDDNLLVVHDVVILTNSSGSGSVGSSSKVRMGLRLDGCAAGTAAAATAEAEAAGQLGPGSSAVLKQPCLSRMDVSMLKERLLACVPVASTTSRSSCADSMLFTRSKLDCAAAGAPDSVLCVDQAGQILLLPPASAAAMPTGASFGSSIVCCCFDGNVAAAAKREGAVTVMTCHPGHTGAQPTPQSGDSGTAGAGVAGAAAPVGCSDGAVRAERPEASAAAAPGLWGGMAQPAAAVAAAAAAAAAAGASQKLDIAVSAKLDMLVLGISVCKDLGRVALAGSERKNTHNGVVFIWEYDPSVRPPALNQQGTLRGLSGAAGHFTRQHSNRSMLSSRESADDSIGSPTRVSIDLDLGLHQVKGAGIDSSSAMRWPQGREVVRSPLAARARRLGNGTGGPAARLSNADSTTMDAAGAAAEAAMSAPTAVAPAASGSPLGWLWHCDNPVKVLGAQDSPMLCCAWTKGPELPKLVVGSSAGWVVVVDCEGEEMEDALVSEAVSLCMCMCVNQRPRVACASRLNRRAAGHKHAGPVHKRTGTLLCCEGVQVAAYDRCRWCTFGLQCRYQIHDCSVSAIDCSSDGSTVCSGGSDGRVVLWSHVTGFKLAVFTLHSGAIHSLAFNHGESHHSHTHVKTHCSGASLSRL